LKEVKKIATLVPSTQLLVTGAAAHVERVRQEAPTARVLHFATHAIEDSAQSFQSFLALSDSSKLTAQAIYDLQLEADLVMLTACRSGAGRISADGLLGFTRAFLYAGAASVIAPLWDVPDEPTVQLVEEFYRRYQRGASKSVALREAQLKLLNSLRAGNVTVSTPAGPMPLPAHPALWAGFVLQGAN
jgi:CHAT domain-containing protein